MQDTNFQREVLDRLIVLETLLKQQDYKGLSEKVELDHEKIIKDEHSARCTINRAMAEGDARKQK